MPRVLGTQYIRDYKCGRSILWNAEKRLLYHKRSYLSRSRRGGDVELWEQEFCFHQHTRRQLNTIKYLSEEVEIVQLYLLTVQILKHTSHTFTVFATNEVADISFLFLGNLALSSSSFQGIFLFHCPFPSVSTMSRGPIDYGSTILVHLGLMLEMGKTSSSFSSSSAPMSSWAVSIVIVGLLNSLLFFISGSLFHTDQAAATTEELSCISWP